MNVRRLIGVAPLIVAAIPTAALARDCNEVKAEIDAKIKAKGVMNYVLQIVDGSDAKEGKIVGNCDIGAKSIVYFRKSTGKSPIKLSSTSPKQPQHVSVSPVLELTGPASATASRAARPSGAVVGNSPRGSD